MLSTLRRQYQTHLHWQILLPMLMLFLLFGTIGLYLIRAYLVDDFEVQLIKHGELAAHSIQFAVESASTVGGIQRYVASVGAEDGMEFIAVVAGTPPRVVASTNLSLIGGALADIKHENVAADLVYSLNTRKSHYEHEDTANRIFSYSSPARISNIMKQGRPLGDGAFVLQMRTDSLDAAVNNSLLTMSTLFVALLLSLGALVFWLVRYLVLDPQKRLLRAITERQRGEKGLAIISGENELSRLSEEFNTMVMEADRVEKLKSEFVSTVSHELRTPLTAIGGSLGLLLGLFKQDVSTEAQNLLEIANQNTSRLNRLINDILDFEGIESGQIELEKEKVDLVDVTRKAVALNQSFAAHYGVKMAIVKHPEQANLLGDEHRLLQVFANLLSNAIKFSKKGGVVEVSVFDEQDSLLVKIRDFGRGIPEEFRARMFQRFAQADSTDARDRGGTGLGLAITRRIIESHGGNINYASQLGVGTEFRFMLPK